MGIRATGKAMEKKVTYAEAILVGEIKVLNVFKVLNVLKAFKVLV